MVIYQSRRETSEEANLVNIWSRAFSFQFQNCERRDVCLSCLVSGICYAAELRNTRMVRSKTDGPERNQWELLGTWEAGWGIQRDCRWVLLLKFNEDVSKQKSHLDRGKMGAHKWWRGWNQLKGLLSHGVLMSMAGFGIFKMATKSLMQEWRARKAGHLKTMSWKEGVKQFFVWSLHQESRGGWSLSFRAAILKKSWSQLLQRAVLALVAVCFRATSAQWKEEPSSNKSFPTTISSMDEAFPTSAQGKEEFSSQV